MQLANRRGLSIVEMAATLVVLLMISAIAGGVFTYMRNGVKQTNTTQQLLGVAVAQQLHYDQYGFFVDDVEVAGVMEPNYTFISGNTSAEPGEIAISQDKLPVGQGVVGAIVMVTVIESNCVAMAVNELREVSKWSWEAGEGGCSARQAVRVVTTGQVQSERVGA